MSHKENAAEHPLNPLRPSASQIWDVVATNTNTLTLKNDRYGEMTVPRRLFGRSRLENSFVVTFETEPEAASRAHTSAKALLHEMLKDS